MKNFINKLKNSKGITGIDVTVAILVIVIFTGVISSLMANLYELALEMRKSAEANAYVTMVLEKIDEKPYEDLTNTTDFASNLISKGELDIDSGYTVTVAVESYIDKGYEKDVLKKATVTISYTVNNQQKSFSVSKLKVKEIGD